MSTPGLPNELFFHLFGFVTSSNELAFLTYSCKTFAEVIKPLLYSHVTIKTEHQRETLWHIKEEDVKFIKKVSIIGNDRVWSLKVHSLSAHFSDVVNEAGEVEVCEMGYECVRDVFESKMFDIRGVESIVVRDIHECPIIEVQNSSLSPSILSNLYSLSIITHRGGARLWKSVLTKEHLPSLRRLALYDVTTFERAGSVAPVQYQTQGTTILSFESEIEHLLPRGDGTEEEYAVAGTLLEGATELLEQLEILVSPYNPHLIEELPHVSHLSFVAEDSWIDANTKHAVMHIGKNTFSEALDNIFMQIQVLVDPEWENHNGTLEYLSLMKFVEGLYEQGNADDSSQIIPRSFIDYVAEKKKQSKESEAGEHVLV